MKAKFNWRHFDKLFKITDSTPLDFYEFMQFGVAQCDFPCRIEGYMDKYYLEDHDGIYKEELGLNLFEITPVTEMSKFRTGEHVKFILPLPQLIVIDDGDEMRNSSIFYQYRVRHKLQKLLNAKFIKHYKLIIDEETNE